MAQTPADPIGRDGGNFNITNPTIVVTPAPADSPSVLPPAPAFKQVGAPLLVSVDDRTPGA
jgi:hypothetical protein